MSSVSREELYEEIWAEPMTTVAKRYGVSSNYLARICERLKVPRPPRGYWAKLKVGKRVRRAPLPPARPSDEHAWRTDRMWGSGGVPPEHPPTAILPEPLGPRAKSTIVRDGLHATIWGAKEAFASAGHDQEGYLRPERWEVPDVLISKDVIKRALAFMNSLFLALEARGHDVVFAPRDRDFRLCLPDLPDERLQRWQERPRWRPRRPTLTFVGEVAVGLSLVELNEEMPAQRLWDQKIWIRDTRKYPKERDSRVAGLFMNQPLRHWLPNGRLRLRAYSPYPMTEWHQDWTDDETKLEKQRDAIIETIEAGAQGIPALVVQARHEYDEHCRKVEEQHREWQRREAQERYERAAAASHDALLTMVRDWSEAEAIRRFLGAIESRLGQVEPAAREALAAKLARAREMLGSPDAIDWLASWTPPPRPPDGL